MSVMHFANALVWEIIGPAMAGPCAMPLLLRNRNHNLPGARCTKNLKIYFILRFYKLVQQASVWYSIEGLGKIQNGHINRYMLVTFKQEILSRTVTSMVAFHMNVIS